MDQPPIGQVIIHNLVKIWVKAQLLQYPDTPSQMKSFEVLKSYVEELRATAVKERNLRRIRTKEHIDRLRSIII
ncbi:hypothetical protein NIES2101_39110 [Calothrix sp. HK-06]|nr:hypothetical protein NIES2101_39110 [Calothrix sp. HK-06]